MPRLIDANPIGRKITEWLKDPLKKAESAEGIMFDVLEELRKAKIIEATEVVLCKDCRHYNGLCYCEEFSIGRSDYDFCSDGEWRNENAD